MATALCRPLRSLPTGSSDAFRDLHQGLCDIGMASRPITEAERNYLMPVCGNLAVSDAQFVLGMDALAIIVSPRNKLSEITLEQLRHVFVGDITDWSGIGARAFPSIFTPGRIAQAPTNISATPCCWGARCRTRPRAIRRTPRSQRGGQRSRRDRLRLDVHYRGRQGARGGGGGLEHLYATLRGDGAIGPIPARLVPLSVFLCPDFGAAQFLPSWRGSIGSGPGNLPR